MKIMAFIILIASCFPLVSPAQIVTGGTGAHDSQSIAYAMDKMTKLSKHLIRRDRICGSTQLLKKNDGIMQVYLKLSLKKQNMSTLENCEAEEKYFMCLADSKTTALALLIKNSNTAPLMLSLKFNISIDQAHRMLLFYSTLGEK